MSLNNRCLMADSYKPSQAPTYPDGTEYVYSYIESRGGDYDKNVMFGPQMLIKQYFTKPLERWEVDEAVEQWTLHGEPFDAKMWYYIVDELGGKWPIEIRAVPEGTVIGTKNVLATVVNTDPKCFGLVSFIETILLQAVWYPTTVATNSYRMKLIIDKAFETTSDSATPEIDSLFKLHDFGYRGVSSQESAGIGGLAHLLIFRGSDTMRGIQYGREFYSEPMAGFSIPAGEHSCVTSYGPNGEVDYLRKMIKLYGKPGALFACPIDSYNTWNFIDSVLLNVVDELKVSGATFVLRPDSGDPLTTPIKVVERLGELYGYTTNSKGYKVLPSYLRVIQGDGITLETLPIIVMNLKKAGWSIDNLAFGMGGGLLQHVNRDTYKFAMKCSAIKVNGAWRDVFKDPIDQPDKASKKGRFHVIKIGDVYKSFNAIGYDIIASDNILRVIYKDGTLLVDETLAIIRERVAA